MYLKHYGLREMPFSLTPDTAFFFNHSGQQEAMNVLLVALRSGEGFVKITGEVGTGKTMLCRKLLRALEGECVTAYLPNPLLRPIELYRAFAEELGIDLDAGLTSHDILKAVNHRLIELNASDTRVVLVIDEVQTMPTATLESLRLISNLETEKSKLLQIVLLAQPELDRRLKEQDLRQLRQRITFSYALTPLDRRAVDGYVAHRLLVAGHDGFPLFKPGAMRRIYASSRGIPRLVNILCHKALLTAYGKGDAAVSSRHVRMAVRDAGDNDDQQHPLLPAFTRALLMVVFIEIFVALYLVSGGGL